MTALKNKSKQIVDFLSSYEKVHQVEFLKKYPIEYPPFLRPWIDELESWDFSKLAKLESFPSEELVEDDGFKKFLMKVRSLIEIPVSKIEEDSGSKRRNLKLSDKKRHEISQIKRTCDFSDIQTIVDIGGGVGNLSENLVKEHGCHSICIDMSKSFQDSGKKRLRNSEDLVGEKISFENMKFKEDSKIKLNHSPGESMIIGLHGCGALSNSITSFASKNDYSKLMSFSCCYHKHPGDPFMSDYMKEVTLSLTKNSLHLASRCGKVVGEKELLDRYHFKKYRYLLHYFLVDHFGASFSSIGNATKDDYRGPFEDYGKKFCDSLGYSQVSKLALKEFSEDECNLRKFHRNFVADGIRLLFGRVIETLLCLDRAMFLEESGYEVAVREVFDRRLSPRNILVEAKRKLLWPSEALNSFR